MLSHMHNNSMKGHLISLEVPNDRLWKVVKLQFIYPMNHNNNSNIFFDTFRFWFKYRLLLRKKKFYIAQKWLYLDPLHNLNSFKLSIVM